VSFRLFAPAQYSQKDTKVNCFHNTTLEDAL
jgi:hypothetical protein